MESVGVVVGDPGAGGHGQDSLAALHPHTEQLHRPGTNVPEHTALCFMQIRNNILYFNADPNLVHL